MPIAEGRRPASACPGGVTPPNRCMLSHPSGVVPVLATLLWSPLVAQGPAGDTKNLPLAIDRPAPDLGLTEWLGDAQVPRAIGEVLRVGGAGGGDLPGGIPELGPDLEKKIQETIKGVGKAMNAGRKQPGDLAQHHKKVIVVPVIDWAEPTTSTDLIELVRNIVAANEDREVQVLAIMAAGKRSEQRAKDARVTWPAAVTPLHKSASPYINPSKQSRVFLIGRSGQLAWRGNPTSDRSGFLRALGAALNQLGAARIERDLGEGFDSALRHYYAESTTKALAQAKRLKSSAKNNERQAADAEHLTSLAKATELQWLRAMRAAGKRRRDFDDYVRHIDGLVNAFPRTSGKDAKAHEKATSRKSNYGLRLKDERGLMALQQVRPALFPALKNKANDRFAKRLDKFLGGKRLTDEAGRRAQDLSDRYRAAR